MSPLSQLLSLYHVRFCTRKEMKYNNGFIKLKFFHFILNLVGNNNNGSDIRDFESQTLTNYGKNDTSKIETW